MGNLSEDFLTLASISIMRQFYPCTSCNRFFLSVKMDEMQRIASSKPHHPYPEPALPCHLPQQTSGGEFGEVALHGGAGAGGFGLGLGGCDHRMPHYSGDEGRGRAAREVLGLGACAGLPISEPFKLHQRVAHRLMAGEDPCGKAVFGRAAGGKACKADQRLR
jgi:hypothetical protein